MRKNKWILAVLGFAFLLRISIIVMHTGSNTFHFQQDNYADYASAINNHTLQSSFPKEDRRLFPGYPLLLFTLIPIFSSPIIAGVIISLASAMGALFLFWRITKSYVTTVLFAFFPPIWVLQSTKVATEPLLVFLLLASIIFFQNKKYFITGLIIGLAFDIRIIAICFLAGLCFIIKGKTKKRDTFSLIFGFFLTASLLFLYNFFAFGSNHFFQQFEIYPHYGRATVGASQFVQDIFRTVDWKQYRILFSGLFYVCLYVFGLVTLYKIRRSWEIANLFFYWMLFSLIFIFSLGPTPFLEEFSRLSTPLTPALAFAIAHWFSSRHPGKRSASRISSEEILGKPE